jgi:hypothetical protein
MKLNPDQREPNEEALLSFLTQFASWPTSIKIKTQEPSI